mmetsp:Transcript_52608/g.140206  ORF Transcript_52608/g.140206 Transcript_52608/m.140206 type:complete len:296 (-) Transcript_52608:116-1003(-)
MKSAVSDLVAPELERHNVSDCSVVSQQRKEQQLLQHCAGPPPPNQRAVAVALLSDVARYFGSRNHRRLEAQQIADNLWCEAVQMVDLVGSGLPLCTDFFSRVAAAWFISTKCSESVSPDINVRDLDALASLATMHSRHHDCGDVTASLICKQEAPLIMALCFDTSIPTIWTWMVSLVKRLNVITQEQMTVALHNLSAVAHIWLVSLVSKVPCSCDASPETLVVGGLFCVFVHYGVVNCEEVREIVPGPPVPRVETGMNPNALKAAFEYATLRDMAEIIKFCTKVTESIRISGGAI